MDSSEQTTIVDAGTPMTLETTASKVLAEAQALHAGEAGGKEEEDTGEGGVEDSPEAEEEDTSTSKGLSWDDALKRMPPDVRALARKMQADYTRKTQELARQRKEMLRERQSLRKGTASLKPDRELPEYDPYNEEAIQARIEAEVDKRLKAVLEPMEREYEVLQAEEKYQSFLNEHPDFKTDTELRTEVQKLLEANESLDLNTAYWAAKGKLSRAAGAQEAAQKKARKEAALKGTGRPRRGPAAVRPSTADLKKMDSASILQMARALNGIK